MKPLLLVLRSGERPFPPALVPGLDLVERRTHDFETLAPPSPEGEFDLVLFTSGSAVRRFLSREDLAARLAGGARVYAVGPATAELLREGGVAGVREAGGSARALLETMAGALAGVRVLLPRGEDADDALPRGLAQRGAAVLPLTLYRKTPLDYDPTLDEALGGRPPAVFLTTSPSAAAWLFAGASAESARRLRRTAAIALGRPTREALVSRGVQRVEIARPPTFESAALLAVRLAAAGGAT